MSSSGLPSTSSRSASRPLRMVPKRFPLRSSFAALAGGGLRRHARGNSGLHPELQFAMQRGAVEHHGIAGIAPHHQRHAGLPGAQQIGARLFECPAEERGLSQHPRLCPKRRNPACLSGSRRRHVCCTSERLSGAGIAREVLRIRFRHRQSRIEIHTLPRHLLRAAHRGSGRATIRARWRPRRPPRRRRHRANRRCGRPAADSAHAPPRPPRGTAAGRGGCKACPGPSRLRGWL